MSRIIDHDETRALTIRWEPGNGTSYRLILAADSQGGGVWLWMEEMRIIAGGWYGNGQLKLSAGKLGKTDRAAILHALEVLPGAQDLLAPVYRWPR